MDLKVWHSPSKNNYQIVKLSIGKSRQIVFKLFDHLTRLALKGLITAQAKPTLELFFINVSNY